MILFQLQLNIVYTVISFCFHTLMSHFSLPSRILTNCLVKILITGIVSFGGRDAEVIHTLRLFFSYYIKDYYRIKPWKS